MRPLQNPTAITMQSAATKPADPADKLLTEIEQDEQLAALIVAYVAAEVVDGAMTEDEVKPLRKGARLTYLRNGLFLATVRLCRRSERPDIAQCMLVVVHALSDNDEGYCWISVPRLARLLNCSDRAIQAARERLEKFGLLLVTWQGEGEVGDNDTNLLRIAVPAGLAGVRPLQVVDALSEPSRARGRPKTGEARRKRGEASRQNGGSQTQEDERLATCSDKAMRGICSDCGFDHGQLRSGCTTTRPEQFDRDPYGPSRSLGTSVLRGGVANRHASATRPCTQKSGWPRQA